MTNAAANKGLNATRYIADAIVSMSFSAELNTYIAEVSADGATVTTFVRPDAVDADLLSAICDTDTLFDLIANDAAACAALDNNDIFDATVAALLAPATYSVTR